MRFHDVLTPSDHVDKIWQKPEFELIALGIALIREYEEKNFISYQYFLWILWQPELEENKPSLPLEVKKSFDRKNDILFDSGGTI